MSLRGLDLGFVRSSRPISESLVENWIKYSQTVILSNQVIFHRYFMLVILKTVSLVSRSLTAVTVKERDLLVMKTSLITRML